jgi:hypothetical protein
MRIAVKIIASVIGIYSIVILAGYAYSEYFTFKYLSEVSEFKIIIGYPLLLNILFISTLILGIATSIGLFRIKQWGRKYLNLLIAVGIVIHIFQVIDSFFPEKLGYTLIEHSGGAIFFTSRFKWQSIFTMYIIIGVFLFINSRRCKNLLEP